MNTKKSSKVLGISLAVLAILMYVFVSWAQDALPADSAAFDALKSDEQVLVIEENGLITFTPVDGEYEAGFIFYPGGRVEYRAYSPILHRIAARGYFVALVPAPINLAFFNTNAASQVMELYPDINRWFVGGHSLGGVTAASYAVDHLDDVAGLVLWASYPGSDALANSDIRAVAVYGTNDMEGTKQIDLIAERLPAGTPFITIEGGNHAQFGSYGPQPGDSAATITAEEQWAQATEITVQFFELFNK